MHCVGRQLIFTAHRECEWLCISSLHIIFFAWRLPLGIFPCVVNETSSVGIVANKTIYAQCSCRSSTNSCYARIAQVALVRVCRVSMCTGGEIVTMDLLSHYLPKKLLQIVNGEKCDNSAYAQRSQFHYY